MKNKEAGKGHNPTLHISKEYRENLAKINWKTKKLCNLKKVKNA